MIHTASRSVARIPYLSAFLAEEPESCVGWGRKASGRRAREVATKKGLPFLCLEDGFLRSVEREAPPLSLVVDDLGIYYDASTPSRLEQFVTQPLDDAQRLRTLKLIDQWRAARVSKYNSARDFVGLRPERFVLVCDQTFCDSSIIYGQANKASFARMLEAAIDDNPDCHVLLKTHPDVFTRGKQGYFDRDELEKHPRVHVVSDGCHPVRLIEEAEAVYTVTSQMGFEALMWGKRVCTFGMPFYASWGLTQDDLPAHPRRQVADLEQLVHAALVSYPRYIDPDTGQRCEVENVLAHISLQREMRERFAPRIHALRFSRWKRPILKRFLAGSDVCFVRRDQDVPKGATLAVWGQDEPADVPMCAKRLRIEDGFLRSYGLGADLIAPLSWVCDDIGIYYDATQPSRLERILSDTEFDQALLARARRLREMILDAGLTKYNLNAAPAVSWRRPQGEKKVILVPGQVEDDASIQYGAPDICTNLGLLRAVRHANHYAHIIYKPHPDVVAGLRPSKGEGRNLTYFFDEIVMHADIGRLLKDVDEVHTLTSLTGFEALMRGKRVTCYGQPFYAGWGLTTDILPVPRRGRKLDLDSLVAATLILYPTYVSRITGQFTTPERAVLELLDWRNSGGSKGLATWRRALRRVFLFAKHWGM